jgi:hypothetical protein
MGEITWSDRVNQIKKIKTYLTDNIDIFANNKRLQVLYESLNRALLDLDENIIDELIIQINQELYD